MRKKEGSSAGAVEWSSTPAGRITPADVQQKEFRVARFGAGYRVREVDEFLDQVTDALSALTQENERLLRGAGAGSTSSPPSVRPTTDDSDSGAVDAFLRREKGFLQDLGGLVQAHAEELRTMIRAVRRDTAPPTPDAPPPAAEAPSADESPHVEPAPTPMVVPEAQTETLPGATETPGAAPQEGSIGQEALEATQDAAPDDGEDSTEANAETTTGVIADEPIRLEDPEPARSKRSDEEEDGSLRELFWGEE